MTENVFLNLPFYTVEAEILANAKHSAYQHPASSSAIAIVGEDIATPSVHLH